MNRQDGNRIILFLMQIKCPVAIVECFDRHVDRTTKIIDGAWIVALHLKDPLPFFNSLLFHDGITSSKILSTIYCLICRRDLFDAYISRDFYMQVQEEMIRQEDEISSEGIEAKLQELQEELLKLANSKKDYNSVADEIDRLRELKQNALVESAEREGLKQRIREMREFLEQQSTEVTEYDELLVRRLIEKATVYDERFEVEFKSGAKVDVER